MPEAYNVSSAKLSITYARRWQSAISTIVGRYAYKSGPVGFGDQLEVDGKMLIKNPVLW